MILPALIGLAITFVVLYAAYWLHRERGDLVSDMREANRRLTADNQRLTEALCAKNGEPVTLTPSTDIQKLSEQIAARRAPNPPFFRSAEPLEITVGEKTVKPG